MSKQTKALFVFRQDLRIDDNTALYHAAKASDKLLPIFIFDTNILDALPAADQRIGFIVDALRRLQQQLQKHGSDLFTYHGDPQTIIPQLVSTNNIDAIYWNRSYGKGATSRDKKLKQRASSTTVNIHEHDDFLLVEPAEVAQMKVFTPFYKRWMGKPKRWKLLTIHALPQVLQPQKNDATRLSLADKTILTKLNGAPQSYWHADAAKEILIRFDHTSYTQTKDHPAKAGTSNLSPYTRFGLLSIRTILKQVLNPKQPGVHVDQKGETITMNRDIFTHTFVSELAWREFRHHIHYYFPTTRTEAFQEKRRNLNRVNKDVRFEARKAGKTGYPIVDAGMRQLRSINWMHNRVRMIVASFLTKDLLIDRRRGEQHFADYLLDYDVNVNTGNRQRAASVGADPKPLRIFNPILQSQRYDPQATYIKHRIPELQDQPLTAIHDPIKYDLNYHQPIVDHYVTSKLAKKMYYHEPFSL